MWAFGSNMVSKITTIVAPTAMMNKYAQVIFNLDIVTRNEHIRFCY